MKETLREYLKLVGGKAVAVSMLKGKSCRPYVIAQFPPVPHLRVRHLAAMLMN
jgi:hypothetical protein